MLMPPATPPCYADAIIDAAISLLDASTPPLSLLFRHDLILMLPLILPLRYAAAADACHAADMPPLLRFFAIRYAYADADDATPLRHTLLMLLRCCLRQRCYAAIIFAAATP